MRVGVECIAMEKETCQSHHTILNSRVSSMNEDLNKSESMERCVESIE